MSTTSCSNCGSKNLRWVTLRQGVPVDVLQCQDCGHAELAEDWTAPLAPLVPGRCINCGDVRKLDVCVTCGLLEEGQRQAYDAQGRCIKCGDTHKTDMCENCGFSQEDDVQVHDELRQMVAPTHNLLNAARAMSKMGRRVLALKLATAAAATNEDGRGDVARALRIWLLSAVGEGEHALNDARSWVDQMPDPPALAWASLGQQLEHNDFPGAAADAYDKSLGKNPGQHSIRARRALLLIDNLQREGQAQLEALYIMDNNADERSLRMALLVAEKLCELYVKRNWLQEIEHLISRTGAHVNNSAVLLAHRAKIAATKGQLNRARKDLKRARSLNPDLPIYKEVQQIIKPQRASWWSW